MRALRRRGAALAALAALATLAVPARAAQDLYCGDADCYEVLAIDASATLSDVKRAYRRLSMERHPDRVSASGAGAAQVDAATAAFMAVAQAYEVLSSAERRADYDYYLAHPEQRMYNEMRYYMVYAPKTDARLVVALVMALSSALHLRVLSDNYRRVSSSSPEVARRVAALLDKKVGGGAGSGSGAEAAERDARARVLAELDAEGLLPRPRFQDAWIIALLLLPLRAPELLRRRRECAAAAAAAAAAAEAELAAAAAAAELKQRATAERYAARQLELATERERVAALEARRAAEERAARQDDERRQAEAKRARDARHAAGERIGAALLQAATALGRALGEVERQVIEADARAVVSTSGGVSAQQLEKLAADASRAHESLASLDEAIVALRKTARRATAAEAEDVPQQGDGPEWSEAELSALSKAANKYPGGSRNRWLMVANGVNAVGGAARTPEACAKRVGALLQALSQQQRQQQQQDQQPPQQQQSAPEPESSGERPWTVQEQRLLETGLERFGKVPDVKERWRSIAALVPGRSAKDCALHFKEVRQGLLAARAPGQ
jgi:hypothetical protein